MFFYLAKDKFFNNGVNCVIPWWQWSIFGSAKSLQSIRDAYWKLRRHPFILTRIHPFQAIYFLVYYYFYLRSTIYMLLKWFGITVNTKFLEVLEFDLFIQICLQVSLSLKLDNVTRIFWSICLAFETWSGHYLLAKVLIKMKFLIPS